MWFSREVRDFVGFQGKNRPLLFHGKTINSRTSQENYMSTQRRCGTQNIKADDMYVVTSVCTHVHTNKQKPKSVRLVHTNVVYI